MIIFYLGPDSLLPLGSILAALAGFVLLFGNRVTGLFRSRRKPQSDDSGNPPTEETESPDSLDRSGS